MARQKALHKLRPFLVAALPSSEGVAARSLLPTASDLDAAHLRLRVDGVLVDGKPMTMQEESFTCWTT